MSTVNECIFIILLLASVRLHILHCSGSSRASFERLSFQKLVQVIQQNLSFCQSRSEKTLLLKSRILKIRQAFSSFFEDRKRLFGSVFDSKLASPRKGPFCTLAKCFVLYHFGDHSGFYARLRLFCAFSIFFSFSLFLHRRQKCVPRLGKTYNS